MINRKMQFVGGEKLPVVEKQRFTEEELYAFDLKNIEAELARRKHIEFMQYCWNKPAEEPFIVGIHTKAICDEIDAAVENYKKKISTFLMIKVPYRHGKSDIVSRFLPTHFLGEFPSKAVLLASYNSELSQSFSRDARKIMRSEQYVELYPSIKIADDQSNVSDWAIQGNLGKTSWVGLGGGISGKTGDLIIVDDFLKNYEEALSESNRSKMWQSFCDDVLTRRSPTCIFIILATPRHVDDIFGRISSKMLSDVNFPHFKEIKFPARKAEYKSGYLFPERFSKQYYLEQYATLSQNSAAALLDCDPQIRGGNLFKIDNIKIVEPNEWNEKTKGWFWTRGWDLASSEEQRLGDNPDYSVGIKSSVRRINGQPLWFVADCKFGKWEAPTRNAIILELAELDGDTVPIGIEAFAAYKDAFVQIRDALQGRRTVQKIMLPGDKAAKASRLEPIFEAGNVYLKKADWNQEFIKQFSDFPSSTHDDIVDASVVSYSMHGNQIVAGRI